MVVDVLRATTCPTSTRSAACGGALPTRTSSGSRPRTTTAPPAVSATSPSPERAATSRAPSVSSGQITGIGGITCYAGGGYRDGQLKWGSEDTVTDGDSGSVSFHPDPERPDEQVLVAGLDNARTWWPGANYTWGTAASHVCDRHGLSF